MSKLSPMDEAVNRAVARITGINKRLFSDSGTQEVRSAPSYLSEVAADMVDYESEQSQPRSGGGISVAEAIAQMKTKARGDNAAFDYPKATDSQDEKIPSHKMADQDVDDEMYGAVDQDSDPQTVNPKKATSESVKMKKFIKENIHSIETYRMYAGLPLLEDKTGDVPTAGAHKSNTMKSGGLPGLEGQALQDIDPKQGPCDDDEVGSDEYEVLDQAIAMLKKEGVDTEDLWAEFLENRGLTVELFHQLVDEAMDGDDAEEMDALIAVEEMFYQALPQMLPEGLGDLFRRKKPVDDTMSALNRSKAAMNQYRQQGVTPGDIRASNARGMKVSTSAPPAAGQKVSLVRPPDAPPEEFSPGGRYKRANRQTVQLKAVKAEGVEMELECADDGMGNPSMPWMSKKAKKKSKMESLAGKYAVEGKMKPGKSGKDDMYPQAGKKAQVVSKKPKMVGKK